METSVVRNPYLEGNFAPVREEVRATDLPVTGTLPRELNGRYLRIGPNPLGPTAPARHHWFLGEGMVHGVRLRDGRAEWYRNALVRGDHGEAPNTNVVAHHSRILTLVEGGGVPVEVSPDLARMSTWDADGALQRGFAAHPKIDPRTGELHAVTYAPGAPSIRHVVLDPAGALAGSTDIAVDGSPMVHDMAITERHIVLLDLPVTLSRPGASRSGLSRPSQTGPYDVDRFPFRWNDDHTPRLGLLSREGGGVRWFDAPRCYVFHVLNGYDADESTVVVDVVRYDTVFRDELRAPADSLPGLARWTVDLARGTVTEQMLSERSVEFPRVDPALIGRPHRFGWFAGFGADGLLLSDDVERQRRRGFETGPLVKIDTATGESEVHDYGPGRVTMEPAFVPRPDAVAEDDGWILSVVYDATTESSELVVVAAADLASGPVARVYLPQRVPFGFHGNWVDDRELRDAG